MKQVIGIIHPAVGVGVFHLAQCKGCIPELPEPFYDPLKRNEWAALHQEATGHPITLMTEIRIETRDDVISLLHGEGRGTLST